jgi:TolA-binding protein
MSQDDFVLAKKAFDDEFYDISQEQLERFLLNYPKSQLQYDAHLLLGRCYTYLGKYSQSIKEFDIVLSSASANRLHEEALYWSAEAYFQGKDYKGALNRYAEEMDSYPNSKYSVFSAYSKCWCYFNMGDYDNAISSFKAFIEKYPSDNLVADAKFKIAESVLCRASPLKPGPCWRILLRNIPSPKNFPIPISCWGR